MNGVIVYLAYVILSFSIFFYSTRVSDNWMFMIPLAVCCILSILMLFAQYYIPVMIVTFDLKLRHIYRNAFYFLYYGSVRTDDYGNPCGFIHCVFVLPGGICSDPAAARNHFPVCVHQLSDELCDVFVARYVPDPAVLQKRKRKRRTLKIRVAKDGDTFNFDNDELDDDDDDKPQYVYVNGRLIDRKIMEQESLFSDKTDTSDHLQ